jgi:hypothetical protein
MKVKANMPFRNKHRIVGKQCREILTQLTQAAGPGLSTDRHHHRSGDAQTNEVKDATLADKAKSGNQPPAFPGIS